MPLLMHVPLDKTKHTYKYVPNAAEPYSNSPTKLQALFWNELAHVIRSTTYCTFRPMLHFAWCSNILDYKQLTWLCKKQLVTGSSLVCYTDWLLCMQYLWSLCITSKEHSTYILQGVNTRDGLKADVLLGLLTRLCPADWGLGVRMFRNFLFITEINALWRGSECARCSLSAAARTGVPPGDLLGNRVESLPVLLMKHIQATCYSPIHCNNPITELAWLDVIFNMGKD